MSRYTISRNDRVAQMSKQEEIIEKKKREISEKQKTAELAKAVAAATNEGNKIKSDDKKNEQGASPRNTFNNDGSFLEKFKKILEAAKKETEKDVKPKSDNESEETLNPINQLSVQTERDDSLDNDFKDDSQNIDLFEANELISSKGNFENDQKIEKMSVQSSVLYNITVPPPFLPPTTFQLPPPLFTPKYSQLNESHSTTNIQSPIANLFPPTYNPTVPPPIPFPALHTIPSPKPISLNEIPSPKDLDLNAIPKPELNLDAIKVPDFSSGTSFLTTGVTSKGKDNEIIPTTIETLVEMVAEKGDGFEDKILSQKYDVHSSLWFLFDRESDAYEDYRCMVVSRRLQKQQEAKYDPADIYDDHDDDEDDDDDYNDENDGDNDDDDNDNDDGGNENLNDQFNDNQINSISRGNYEQLPRQQDDEIMLGNMKRRLVNYYKGSDESSDSNEEDLKYVSRRTYYDNETGTMKIESHSNASNKRKRSRWGEKVQQSDNNQTIFENQSKPLLKPPLSRTNPAFLQYVMQNFGSTELTDEDWKKAEDHYKINLLYQDMLNKRQQIDRLAKSGQFKYEYDSDEDIDDGGTWEHKLRMAEMDATKAWAEALTKQSEGRHHIGDFLPPEELKKFMEKYNAKKNNREPDMSDYKEYKLTEENIGFQMLKKLGWNQGQGLGADGKGIVDPINKASQRELNQGLGANSNTSLDENDDEYDAYRKRMMIAYRFRPNPLNNPRRAYY